MRRAYGAVWQQKRQVASIGRGPARRPGPATACIWARYGIHDAACRQAQKPEAEQERDGVYRSRTLATPVARARSHYPQMHGIACSYVTDDWQRGIVRKKQDDPICAQSRWHMVWVLVWGLGAARAAAAAAAPSLHTHVRIARQRVHSMSPQTLSSNASHHGRDQGLGQERASRHARPIGCL